MALNGQFTINAQAYQAGQTPPPAVLLTVYNPNASAVVVTGIELIYTDQSGAVQKPSVAAPLVPIGVGQTVSVPSLSTITIGPFALAVGSGAAASSFQMVPPGSTPVRTQGSQLLQQEVWVGGLLYASDGSVNIIGKTRVLVSYTPAPPRGYQGGDAHFSAPNNACLLAGIL